MIKVIVHGALGRMGQAVINTVCEDSELELVGSVDIKADRSTLQLPTGTRGVPLFTDLEPLLDNYGPDVVVDFTQHDAIMPAARTHGDRTSCEHGHRHNRPFQ